MRGGAILGAALLASAAAAQTPPPPTMSNAAENARVALAAAAGPRKIVIVADSTAAEYGPDRYPQLGWGQVLKCRLDGEVGVLNLARGGRSSKSYIAEGFFSDMVKQVTPGDTVLIQFGHNDSAEGRPERYTDPATDFRENLRAYVAVVRARSAVPVLITPVAIRRFVNGHAVDAHGAYARAVREVAAATGTPLIDLSESSRALIDRLGEAPSRRYFLHYTAADRIARFPQGVADDVHFSETGARAIAALVADGLRASGAPVAAHVRPGPPADAPQRVLGRPDCP